MAGGKKSGKRSRKWSDPQSKSPTESQLLKRFKNREVIEGSDSEYLDAEDREYSDSETEPGVSRKNMAGTSVDMTEALIQAFENPTVVSRLIKALRNEIHSSFKTELKDLKSKIKERDQRIQDLEAKVEGLEMYGRRNGIRIHGIPESPHENTDNIVIKLASDIGANTPESALGRSHRVGPKVQGGPSRAIIAKFVGHNHKVNFLKHKGVLRDTEEARLKDIYVNEDLTKKRAGWAKQGRVWRKAKKIKESWTRDGVLFLKKLDETVTRVDSDKDLHEFATLHGLRIDIPNYAYNAFTDEDDDDDADEEDV